MDKIRLCHCRQWLYWIARGIDLEVVTPRFASKSIACCKKFPGRNAIAGIATLNHWLRELGKEISERLEKDEIEYNRRPRQLVVSYMQAINGNDVSSSRSVPITNPVGLDDERLAVEALDVLKKNTEKFFKDDKCKVLNNPIKFLGLSVGKFESTDAKKGNTIQDMFRRNVEAQAAASICDDASRDSILDDDNASRSLANNDQSTTNVLAVPTEKVGDIKSFFTKYRKSVSPVPFAAAAETDANTSTTSAISAASTDAIYDTATDIEMDENSMHEINPPNPVVDQTPSVMSTDIQQPSNVGHDTEPVTTIIDGPQASTSSAPPSKPADYTATYAEFHRPATSHTEIPTTECPQCNKSVKVTELQTHTDAHLAYQLSIEQREEFRSTFKSNVRPTQTSPPAAKRLKPTARSSTVASNATAITTTTPSLDRFLIRKEPVVENRPPTNSSIDEPQPSTSDEPTLETEVCSECHKQIPITLIVEHMDYHVAKKLQLELQRAEMNAPRSEVNAAQKRKIVYTKSKKKSGGNNAKCTNLKSVASFFAK